MPAGAMSRPPFRGRRPRRKPIAPEPDLGHRARSEGRPQRTCYRAVDDGGHVQGSEVAGEIDSRVHRGQERERAFVGIAVALVIDVVEDEAVDPHRSESLEGHFGDLPGLPWSCREPRWRHREKQKLTRPVGDAALQVQARNRSPPTNGSTPGGTRVAAIRAQATGPLVLQRKRRELSDTTAFVRQLRAIQQVHRRRGDRAVPGGRRRRRTIAFPRMRVPPIRTLACPLWTRTESRTSRASECSFARCGASWMRTDP